MASDRSCVAKSLNSRGQQVGFQAVGTDTIIGGGDSTVLIQSITLPAPTWVYLQSDGRVWPSGGGSYPAIWIAVDGATASNLSVVDWSASKSPQQHSYNTIGAVYLQAGTHTFTLHAKSLNSHSFTLGAASNLDVLVDPASTVSMASPGTDTGVLSYNVAGLNGQSVLPTQSQANISVNGNNGSTLVALASSRIYEWGNQGDPLITIGLDGSTLPNDQASWSDNDMYVYAEKQAPFFAHAFVSGLSSTTHDVSLLTTAIPYTGGQSNTVQYRMGGDSRVIALQGGMAVAGSAPQATDAHNVLNYICVATSSAWAGCPSVGENVVLAQADIVIPQGHNGVVLITGKTRVQGDSADPGGVAYLFLTVDGVQMGSLGVQQLASPDSVSTRTMGTSYLASGSHALSLGTHHVILYGKATGNFRHLAMTRDIPLIWFD